MERTRETQQTLADVAGSRDNAFDALRLFAAILVLISHSFALTALGEPRLGSTSLGVIGVEIFFTISGFLVIRSWLSQPHLGAFVIKRALRIVPALVVCLVASAYLLGPLVTDQGTGRYLGSSEPARYVADSLVAIGSGGTVDHVAYELPGAFADNPHQAVNGSLWTLPIEIRAYYLLALLGLLGLFARGLPALAACGLAGLAVMGVADSWGPVADLVEPVIAQEETLLLLTVFATSSLLYLHRERVPLRPVLAALALAGWVALSFTALSGPATALLLPYAVLYAAYRLPAAARRLTAHGDVSYGVYLLAFPIQQVMVLLLGWEIGPWALIAVSLPVVYVLAFLSWRLVESPALRLKQRFPFARTYAIGQDGPARPHPQST
jgi:peptidoglycan/LPS O-acetylase OafA/YrhL